MPATFFQERTWSGHSKCQGQKKTIKDCQNSRLPFRVMSTPSETEGKNLFAWYCIIRQAGQCKVMNCKAAEFNKTSVSVQASNLLYQVCTMKGDKERCIVYYICLLNRINLLQNIFYFCNCHSKVTEDSFRNNRQS